VIPLELRPTTDVCGLDFEPAMLRGDGIGRFAAYETDRARRRHPPRCRRQRRRPARGG